MHNLIVFEDNNALNSFLKSQKNVNESFIYFSASAKSAYTLKNSGEVAYVPEELISAESEFIENEAQKIASDFYKNGEFDYASYKGVSLGSTLEYHLILELSTTLKSITATRNLINKNEFKKIFIVGPGNFCSAVKDMLDQSALNYIYIKPTIFRKFLYSFNKWKEDGIKNKWFGSRFRIFVLEPFFEYLLLIRGALKGIFNNKKNNQGRVLLMSGNRFLYPIYKHLNIQTDLNLVLCGHTFPGRKAFLKDKVLEIEMWISPSIIKEFFQAYIHFVNMWNRVKRDISFQNKFVFNQITFWKRLENSVKMHLLISLPRFYLTCAIAGGFFKKNKDAVMLLASDSTPYDRCLVMAAKNNGIYNAVVQHGLLIEPSGHNKIIADNVFVWGKAAKKWYEGYGNDPKKCIVTGSPKHDEVAKRLSDGFEQEETRKKLGISPNDTVITILTNFVDGFCVSNSEVENFEMIDSVLTAVGAEKDFFIIIKPHPGETLKYYRNFQTMVRTKYKNIIFIKDIDMVALLNVSDVIVSWYSSTVVEAMFLKKLAIIFDYTTNRSLVPYEEYGAALKVKNREGMKEAILNIVNDGDLRKKMFHAQEKFLTEYCYINSNATDKISKDLLSKYAH